MLMTLITMIALAGQVAGAAPEKKPATYPSMAPIEQYLMDRDAEIALARTAAPPSISADATVLVLTPRGYETAVEGKNGFVCIVDRAWQSPLDDEGFWNPKLRAPTCLNAQAARSVLPWQHKRTAMALAGLSKEEIRKRTYAAIDKREAPDPEVGAMSYMMSKQQYLGDQFTHWHPHLMFYLPSAMKAGDWGANVEKSPVLLGPETMPDGRREPIQVFLIPLREWSDGSPAESHHKH